MRTLVASSDANKVPMPKRTIESEQILAYLKAHYTIEEKKSDCKLSLCQYVSKKSDPKTEVTT